MLVLASDGVFDVVSYQEAVEICYEHWDDPAKACEEVIENCYVHATSGRRDVAKNTAGGARALGPCATGGASSPTRAETNATAWGGGSASGRQNIGTTRIPAAAATSSRRIEVETKEKILDV